MTRLLYLTCVLAVLFALSTQDDGSTLHLRDIFQGRCYDYKLTRVGNPLPDVDAACKELWHLFANSFAYHSSCGLQDNSYEAFIEAAGQHLPSDESLFWSGTSDLAHRMSQDGQEYVTMEDALIGYLADSLSWCGQESVPGIDYKECPDWGSCHGDSSSVFWEASSTWFAEQASGEIYVLLDGSNPESLAYRPSSFFATVELPNLNPLKVTTVNVMLVKRFDHPEDEMCDTGSLVQLKHDVEARGFHYACEENPPPVLHLLCVDDPSNEQCQQNCLKRPKKWFKRLRAFNPFRH